MVEPVTESVPHSANHWRRHGQCPPCPHAPHDHATPRTGSVHTAHTGAGAGRAAPSPAEERAPVEQAEDGRSETDAGGSGGAPPLQLTALHRSPPPGIPTGPAMLPMHAPQLWLPTEQPPSPRFHLDTEAPTPASDPGNPVWATWQWVMGVAAEPLRPLSSPRGCDGDALSERDMPRPNPPPPAPSTDRPWGGPVAGRPLKATVGLGTRVSPVSGGGGETPAAQAGGQPEPANEPASAPLGIAPGRGPSEARCQESARACVCEWRGASSGTRMSM